MNKSLIAAQIIIAIMIPSMVLATAQAPDVLLYEGKEYALNTNPLQPFLRENPDLLPRSSVISSGNWRGYVAKWRLSDSQLVLVDVLILVSYDEPKENGARSGYESVFSQMFPGRERLRADWYTGHLIIPTGKLKGYVHMGYGSTFKRYLIATVVEGTAIEIRELKLRKFKRFRKSQFTRYQQTEEYSKALAETLEDSSLMRKDAEEFLFAYLSERYLSMVFEEPAVPNGG